MLYIAFFVITGYRISFWKKYVSWGRYFFRWLFIYIVKVSRQLKELNIYTSHIPPKLSLGECNVYWKLSRFAFLSDENIWNTGVGDATVLSFSLQFLLSRARPRCDVKARQNSESPRFLIRRPETHLVVSMCNSFHRSLSTKYRMNYQKVVVWWIPRDTKRGSVFQHSFVGFCHTTSLIYFYSSIITSRRTSHIKYGFCQTCGEHVIFRASASH